MKFVTRFAPSPTGKLHVGGARIAVINDLLCRLHNGKLIIRIEDTDVERNQDCFVDQILQSLNTLGIRYSDVLLQSQRISIYQEYINKLIEKGMAYYCPISTSQAQDIKAKAGVFRSPYRNKDLDSHTGYAVRFRIPEIYADGNLIYANDKNANDKNYQNQNAQDNKISFHDILQGEMSSPLAMIDDFIIMRSDGNPTYHAACVIDDMLSGISHVIRGNDHCINTYKHVLMLNAFQCIMTFNMPLFCHIPLMHSESGEKFSKRKRNAYYIDELVKQCIAPEAIWIYLASIGWQCNHYNMTSILANFDITHLSRSSSQFDMDKLHSINTAIIRDNAYDKSKLYCMLNADTVSLQSVADFLLPKVQINEIKQVIEKITKVEIEYNASFDIEYTVNIASKILQYIHHNHQGSMKQDLQNNIDISNSDISYHHTIDNIGAFNTSSAIYDDLIDDMVRLYDISKKSIFQTLRIVIIDREKFTNIISICNIIGLIFISKRLEYFINKYS